MIRITITLNTLIHNAHRKYANYIGQSFWAFGSIDNHGDYCLAEDKGQPFIFVDARDCVVYNELKNNGK